MGRIAYDANFIEAITGKGVPLNTPEQALCLKQVIGASAKTGRSVSI